MSHKGSEFQVRPEYLQEKLEKALNALKESIEKNPTEGAIRYGLAGLLAVMGRYDEAQLHLEKAESCGVDVSVLRNWLAHRRQFSQETDETT